MDIEAPQWDAWEARFSELAECAQKVPMTGNIKGARHYLCLYGENGLSPEEELTELESMAQQQQNLRKVEVDTSYWQDTILFVP